MKQKSNQKIIKKCEVSPIYSKDNDGNLHFYCDFCGKEMYPDEIRECKAEREKCPRCGRELGTSYYSVGVCLNCGYKLGD
jgi:ribosomal protein L37E